MESIELESPLLLTLNGLRAVLAHFCVRGLAHAPAEDLQVLHNAARYFRQCEAPHFADHIERFLIARKSEPEAATRHLLELQSRVQLFERQFSRQNAIDLLS